MRDVKKWSNLGHHFDIIRDIPSDLAELFTHLAGYYSSNKARGRTLWSIMSASRVLLGKPLSTTLLTIQSCLEYLIAFIIL